MSSPVERWWKGLSVGEKMLIGAGILVGGVGAAVFLNEAAQQIRPYQCHNCGAKVRYGDAKCHNCGARFVWGRDAVGE